MATASSLANSGGYDNAYDAIAASATDSALVTAVTGKKIRVVAFLLNQGDTTPSTVTFNSKGGGAGTAIFPPLKYAANGGNVVPILEAGYFETNVSEGLSVTTGAGSTTGVVVIYRYVTA
jgi:hypothetical protein